MIEINSTSETVNLWDETIECLNENGKEWKDVKSVIVCPRLECRYVRITKNSFEEIARSFDYHNGFGHTEVPESLKLVGEDWWLERGEYDGSEWWEFKTRPNIPDERTELTGFKDGEAMVKDTELVEPLPCPFCGAKLGVSKAVNTKSYGINCDCGYYAPWKSTRREAVAAHNRVAKAVMENGETEK